MKKADKYKMKNQTNINRKSSQKGTGWVGAQSVGRIRTKYKIKKSDKYKIKSRQI